MVVVHDDLIQGSPEWHAKREGLYTGANADKLLSSNGKISLIGDERKMYAQTTSSDFKGNFHTRRGHTLEDEAIEIYEQLQKCKVARPGFITNTKIPNAGYSPDGLREDRTVEVKAFNIKKHLDMYDNGATFKVEAQCHFGTTIAELKLCDLVIYNPDLAKKELNGIPNPHYDPKKAIKIIPIKARRAIAANFKRKLKGAS